MSDARDFVLLLSCPDARGIVNAVSGVLLDLGCNILDSMQHGDVGTGTFCMRVHFANEAKENDVDALNAAFRPTAARFGMTLSIHDTTRRPRVLIMVSRYDHCLNDLLYRWRTGALRMDIPAVVSNHRDTHRLVSSHDIPYHHLPASQISKARNEELLLELVDAERIDFVVLARYMQVLSPAACSRLAGRVINIHHSFLPGFMGAKPYHQAYDRGVKLIGATAHFVTAALDDGPIIEQDVTRVDHGYTAERLADVGRDIETQVLARAVRWHLEHRVIIVGNRTVVFR